MGAGIVVKRGRGYNAGAVYARARAGKEGLEELAAAWALGYVSILGLVFEWKQKLTMSR